MQAEDPQHRHQSEGIKTWVKRGYLKQRKMKKHCAPNFLIHSHVAKRGEHQICQVFYSTRCSQGVHPFLLLVAWRRLAAGMGDFESKVFVEGLGVLCNYTCFRRCLAFGKNKAMLWLNSFKRSSGNPGHKFGLQRFQLGAGPVFPSCFRGFFPAWQTDPSGCFSSPLESLIFFR